MWRQFACAGRIGVSPGTAVDLELFDRIDACASELKLKRGGISDPPSDGFLRARETQTKEICSAGRAHVDVM